MAYPIVAGAVLVVGYTWGVLLALLGVAVLRDLASERGDLAARLEASRDSRSS